MTTKNACPVLVGMLLLACADDLDQAGTLSGLEGGGSPTASGSTTEGPDTTTSMEADDADPSDTTSSDAPDSSGEDGSSSSTGELEPGDGDGESGSESDSGGLPACEPGELDCECEGGSTCAVGLDCIDGACAIPDEPRMCPLDDHELNDTIATAETLDPWEINDSEADYGELTSTLQSFEDIDWFDFHGNDVLFNFVDPRLSLSGATVEACMYALCDNGSFPNFDCEPASAWESTSSDDGWPGCCSLVDVELDNYNCTGTNNEDSTFLISIRDAAYECAEYSFVYQF